jgi:hypothetical protein
MNSKIMLSLATVALFAVAAEATTVDVESTNFWFTATMDVVSEGWVTPSGVATNITDGIAVDTSATDPLIYTNTTVMADGYRVKARVKFVENATLPSVPSNNNATALGALTVYDGKWYGVSDDSWVPLFGTSDPTDGTSYNVTLEFKTNDVARVRYLVDGVALTNSSGVAWINRGRQYATVSKFGVAGYGDITSLSADTVSFFEITITGEALSAYDIDATTDALNAVGGNGLPKWQSIVLGIPFDTKPYFAPIQNADANKIAFTYGNVDPDKYHTGASVAFDVLSMDSIGAAGTFVTNSVAGVAEVTAPDGVKYYKATIRITK